MGYSQNNEEQVILNYFGDFNGDTYDFISIDAEGMDWDILNQMDLTSVKLLCIEHGENIELITGYCNAFGLKRIHQSPQNTIFAR